MCSVISRNDCLKGQMEQYFLRVMPGHSMPLPVHPSLSIFRLKG